MGKIYHATLKTNEIMQKESVTLVPDQYVEIGRVVVKADEQIAMGYGKDDTQQNAQGRIFVHLLDEEENEISGKLRIMMTSSQNIPVGNPPIPLDMDLAALRQGENDRIGQVPFPCTGTMLSKDKVFVFLVCNDTETAQTVSREKSHMLMDITKTLV